MSVLAGLYAAAVAVRNTMYDRALPARRLNAPVISVGNLSVGGSGKTPFVMLLGGLLKQRGMRVCVLSRGYGRKTTGARVVDPAGSPLEFGDEPLLIAQKLGVPVVVGEDRYAAGQLAQDGRAFRPRCRSCLPCRNGPRCGRWSSVARRWPCNWTNWTRIWRAASMATLTACSSSGTESWSMIARIKMTTTKSTAQRPSSQARATTVRRRKGLLMRQTLGCCLTDRA